jgi:dynein heavy chain
MSEVYATTTCFTPVIFILSQGADPNSTMRQFAIDMNHADRFDVSSLGQGQGSRAKKFINNGIKTGNWVMLQNCHLFKSWMPDLEKIVLSFEEKTKIHEDFRLFLTSTPVDYFPIPVL